MIGLDVANFAAWMYVARDKSSAVVFALSMNSFHLPNLVSRWVVEWVTPRPQIEPTPIANCDLA